MVVFGSDLEILRVNDAFCALSGFTREGLLAHRWPYPFWTEAQAQRAQRKIVAIQAGEALQLQVELLHAKGHALTTLLASRAAYAADSGELLGYVATYKDVSEQRFQTRLERALAKIAAASAAGEEDGRTFADLVAVQVCELLDAPAASVIRFEGELLRVVGHAGDFPAPPCTPIDGGSNSAQVALTGKGSRIDDYAALDTAIARVLTAHGIRGAVAVPIHMHGSLWGCIGVMTRRLGGFAPDVERSLERFADLTAVSLAAAEDRAQAARPRAA
jgi:PAS domain S-box-containing protein